MVTQGQYFLLSEPQEVSVHFIDRLQPCTGSKSSVLSNEYILHEKMYTSCNSRRSLIASEYLSILQDFNIANHNFRYLR